MTYTGSDPVGKLQPMGEGQPDDREFDRQHDDGQGTESGLSTGSTGSQNLVVSAVTDDTTAELLGMNPGHDLSENVSSDMHFGSLAGNLLREMPKSRSNRSHLFPAPSSLFGKGSSRSYSPWPDDSERQN